ncbi:MAG: universal stress protein [Chloroflexi bacterium]|nr:universal stress protein [Chloroflexota bacterium]
MEGGKIVFQQLLVAIDGSESSLWAAGIAIELAALLRARLGILSVEEISPPYVATREESQREHLAAVAHFDQLQAPLRQRAEQRGVQAHCAVRSGHEVQAILDSIMEQHCDLLVLGHQGHSDVWGTFLGSTADKLVNHAPCSVLVIRPKVSRSLYKHLLVALDGSPLSWQAFQVSLQLAKVLGATLHTVSVVEGPVAPPPERPSITRVRPDGREWDWTTYFRQVQTLATIQAQLTGVTLETMTREGHAGSVLTASAREGSYDLLVLGATGQEQPWSTTTGGTARKVANETHCAVLLVRSSITQQKVHDVMEAEVASVHPQAPLSEVITHLIERSVKLLVVVDEEQHVLGVITLGHLLTRQDAYRHLNLLDVTDNAEKVGEFLRQFLTTEKTAADVMIAHPFVLTENTIMEDAARWMIAQRITRMPVLDTDGKLVGMVDQAQLLRYYTDLPSATETQARAEGTQPSVYPRTVGETDILQVPLVAAGTPLFEVLRQVQETPWRRVIVIDGEGKAVGVIADRDILASRGLVTHRNPLLALAGRFSLRISEEVFRRRPSSGLLTAQQIKRPHLFAVTPATPVAEAVRLMLAQQIKRLVVVDGTGKPLGLVDRQQLLRSLVEGGAAPR